MTDIPEVLGNRPLRPCTTGLSIPKSPENLSLPHYLSAKKLEWTDLQEVLDWRQKPSKPTPVEARHDG